MSDERPARSWILLSYRVPREPSTPRIAIWRRLDRLGVARMGDGLVALPADARTREQLDWLAQDIEEAGGTATVWLADPVNVAQERAIADQLSADRAAEYRQVVSDAEAARALEPPALSRALRRLRVELRRIVRRDYFPSAVGDEARSVVRALAASADLEDLEDLDDMEDMADMEDTADTEQAGTATEEPL